MRTAIVSCFYTDLHGTKFGGRCSRKGHYRQSFMSLLKIDADFYIYTDTSHIEELNEVKAEFPDKNITIIESRLEDFYMNDLFEKYKDYDDAKTSMRCQEIQYSKSLWLEDVAKKYDYDYYFWIDIGLSYSGLFPNKYMIGHSDSKPEYYNCELFSDDLVQGLTEFTKDKFFIINITNHGDFYYNYYIDDVYYGQTERKYHTIGGILGGNKESVLWFHDAFVKTAKEVTTLKERTYDEEMIFNVLYNRYPEKFSTKIFDLWYHEDNEGGHQAQSDKAESWAKAVRFVNIFEELSGLKKEVTPKVVSKKKRFVVTGCNGYIGSHMCYELKKAYPDCYIIGVDKVEKQHLRHLYDIFDHTDLAMDPIDLSPFDRQPVDAIFHFAANISVEEGELRPFDYYHNNVCGTLRLVRAALSYGVKNFIFSSTAAVYGESSSTLFGHLNENQPMNAFSVYGKSKQMCEEILSPIIDMKVACLRYFNACGRNVEAGLYEEHDPETHLIPLLVKDKTATIFGTDWPTKDGTCVRDYVHVVDICRAHIKAYEHMNKVPHFNHSINIGSGKGYSVREVVDKVNQVIHNGEMIVRVSDRREGDVPYLVADYALADLILDFRPEYTLDDIIESMKDV